MDSATEMASGSSSSRTPIHRATASDPGGGGGHARAGFPSMVAEPLEGIDPPATTTPQSPRNNHNRNYSLNVSTSSPGGGRPPLGRRQPASSTTAAPWISENGLLHIDIPRKFGEAGEYWKFYDELADRHDKDMIKNLADNLDVLLIFAGLFSSVNTAFIVLSLANLSPDPTAHTVKLLTLIAEGKTSASSNDVASPPFSAANQAIVVNCFLSASLSCSLLAAFGAVMAKQWVLYYARGQVGTLESQGRLRQRKLNGVEKWQFQHVVEALPVLLQASLVFFFIGLILYFHSLNVVVAYVVMGFFLAGVVVYALSLFVSVIDPQCPFQTPVSIFARQAAIRCYRWTSKNLRGFRRLVRWPRKTEVEADGARSNFRLSQALPSLGLALGAPAGGIHHHTRIGRPSSSSLTAHLSEKESDGKAVASWPQDKKRKDEEEMIDNQTACWVMETSEHKEALLSTARNIPALRKIEGTELGVDGLAFHRLLSLFKDSLNASRSTNNYSWSSPQTSLLEAAIIYGRALGHTVVGSPGMATSTALSRGLQWPRWRHNTHACDANELVLLKFCITAEIPRDFCANHPRDTMPHPSSALPIYIAAMLEPVVETKDFRVSARKLDRIAMVQWLIQLSLSTPDACSPTIVGFNAWALAELPAMICEGKTRFTETLRRRWWDAYTSDSDLYPTLVSALNVYHHYHRLPSALKTIDNFGQEFAKIVGVGSYIEIYVSLLYAARSIIDMGSQYQETLNEYTMELDGALRQMHLTVQHQIKTTTDQQLANSLAVLNEELLLTMKSLRRDGVDAMLPKMDVAVDADSNGDAVDGEGIITSLDEEHSLSLLQQHPQLPSVIVKALHNAREGTRYAALAIIHDHVPAWFANEETTIHGRFKDAQLVLGLSMCLTDGENFELLSGILAQLVTLSMWRDEIVGTYLLSRFHVRALELLKQEPTLRRLEVYLTVWSSARRFAECAHFSGECETDDVVVTLLNCMLRLRGTNVSRDGGTPQPYIPSVLTEYVGTVRSRREDGDFTGKRLGSAYQSLILLTSHPWWNLVET